MPTRLLRYPPLVSSETQYETAKLRAELAYLTTVLVSSLSLAIDKVLGKDASAIT